MPMMCRYNPDGGFRVSVMATFGGEDGNAHIWTGARDGGELMSGN